MIDERWITTTGTDLLMVLLSGLGIYVVLLALTRLMGLRSFAKMSSFDFAITVAFGSVIASTLLTPSPSLLNGAFGLAVLFGIQYLISHVRRRAGVVEQLRLHAFLIAARGSFDPPDAARIGQEDALREARVLSGIRPIRSPCGRPWLCGRRERCRC
ncbi:MAG: hypothetical protein KatS3mg042_1062 [Rhodothermaceae bacterium]|nr:MAG: hypothetical protein KatS3mg042_1062 [Rhodothermaceae bacterium]